MEKKRIEIGNPFNFGPRWSADFAGESPNRCQAEVALQAESLVHPTY
jgi:hypothetical protein